MFHNFITLYYVLVIILCFSKKKKFIINTIYMVYISLLVLFTEYSKLIIVFQVIFFYVFNLS